MTLGDVRHSVRMLAASPGFTLVAVLTLALGIGANTAIFSIVDAVLLRRTPLADAGRLAVVWETDRNTGTTREPGSYPDFLDYRDRAKSAESVAAFMATEVNFAPDRGEPVRLQALAVTSDFFSLLGVTPAAGRTFTAAETTHGGPAVVVISESFWTSALGRSPDVLGRSISIDGQQTTVIGIVPARSDFGVYQILRSADYARSFADRAARAAVDAWMPLQETPQSLPRSTHPIFMLARLREPLAAAKGEFTSLAADLERAYPENAARGTFIESFEQIVYGPVRPALLTLLGAVGLVVLVACANVASLLLARGTARRREVAVRLALGAGVRRLATQFVAEGLVLTTVAGALGVAVAVAGLRALVALAPPDLPRIAEATVDLRVLATTLAIAVAAGLLFGLVPLLQARRVDVQSVLKADGGQASSGAPDRARLRAALVIGEFALAVMLVIGASLLIQSFWRLARVDAGFDAGGVLKAEYQLPPSRYPVDFSKFPDFKEMHAFTHAVLEKAAAIPGVQQVAVAGNHPIDPGFTNSFSVVGREAEARNWPEISVRRVTAGYFATMSLPLVRGRLITASDTTRSAPVTLINEAASRRFFGDSEPIGKQIRFWGSARTIVGIVGNERFHGLAQEAPPAIYAPLDQAPSANGSGVLLVRTAGDPSSIAGELRAVIRSQDPALAVFGLEPLADTVARSVSERRFTMLVLGLLAAVALMLAAIGIHGVLTYTVSQRTREIGIRMALGAHPGRLLRLVLREGLTLAGIGAVVGVAGAYVLSRLLTSLLFGVAPTDPVTYVIVPVTLCAVALLAAYVPARRAMRIDPMKAIREL